MYNEPPIVRPPFAQPVSQPIIQENPFSSPVVIDTGKPSLYVKKKSNDSWAWKTVVITLLLSPVIWYLLGEIIANYFYYDIKSRSRIAPGIYQYADAILTSEELLIAAGFYGMVWSAIWTSIIVLLICIPLGIYWVVRR
jgi:hypothetical protein